MKFTLDFIDHVLVLVRDTILTFSSFFVSKVVIPEGSVMIPAKYLGRNAALA